MGIQFMKSTSEELQPRVVAQAGIVQKELQTLLDLLAKQSLQKLTTSPHWYDFWTIKGILSNLEHQGHL